MKTPLPEPVAWRFDRPGISKLDSWPHGGDWERLHTQSQLRAAMVAAYEEGVEEAAKACEGMKVRAVRSNYEDAYRHAASAIRKLKETP